MHSEAVTEVAWPHVPLGELIAIHHGYAFPGDRFNEDGRGDVLVTPGNFAIGGGFAWGKGKYYEGPFDERFILSTGDLVVTMTDLSKSSDTLGSPARVPEHPAGKRLLHNQRIGRIEVIRPDRLDARYLYAVLRTEAYRQQVVASATGTTVKHTAPKRIAAVRIPLPPIDYQRLIAESVAAFDDKAENNQRLAATLAAIVDVRFQQMFGRIDPATDLPDRWEIGTLADIAVLHRQLVKGPSDLPFIGLDAMPRGSTVLGSWTSEGPSGQTGTFARGDILFGKLRPYFRKVGVAPVDGRCSTEILAIRSTQAEYYGVLLGHLASQRFIDHCVAVSRGTRMPRSEWTDAATYEIAVPPSDVAAELSALVSAAYSKIHSLVHEARTLGDIRAAVLPRLVSGHARVITTDPEPLLAALPRKAA